MTERIHAASHTLILVSVLTSLLVCDAENNPMKAAPSRRPACRR